MITDSAPATAKAKSEAMTSNPNQEMLERVRDKQAKGKADEEDAIAQIPNKAVCEREERMANVQLKAYWACFPLTPSPTCLENREARLDITGQANIAAPRKRDRKQLLETLRSSIEEKGQAEAKTRKVKEPLKLPANSETDKDPKYLNRGSKVEVGKDDLQ